MSDDRLALPLQQYVAEAGLDTVDGAFAYADGVDLSKPNLGRRRRTRIDFCDAENRAWEMYLKRYGQPSLARRIGRLLYMPY